MLLPDERDRIQGCLLGGATGDALGEPVEFLSLAEITATYGHSGITHYPLAIGRITDDTQMTMWTAKGLLGAAEAVRASDNDAVADSLYQAYLGWYATQAQPEHRRGPGHTCLGALGSGRMGTIANPLNDSKGCGGVMRVAPVGLALPGRPEAAYGLGVVSAAITHGHPGGYTPAGFMAALVSMLMTGLSLRPSLRQLLAWAPVDTDTRRLILAAIKLAEAGATASLAFAELGAGWTGDEALAIALYAALTHPADYERAVVLAVNHSGDSDSTGCICGAILGAALGRRAIPGHLLAALEERDALVRLADDMLAVFGYR